MKKTGTLKQNRDFLQVYRRGKKLVSPYAVFFVRPNRRGYNRLGITAGKKVGSAVKRNRAKRVMRQAYLETEHLMPTGIDLIIVGLSATAEISSEKLRKYLETTGVKRIWKLSGISREEIAETLETPGTLEESENLGEEGETA